VRRQFGGPGVSDGELVLRVQAGGDTVKAMPAGGAPREYLGATQPLVRLIEELAKKTDCRQIYIRKGKLAIHLAQRGAPPQDGESPRPDARSDTPAAR
jgi:hypothetical protein